MKRLLKTFLSNYYNFFLDSLFEPEIQDSVRDYLDIATEGSTAIFSSLVVSYRGFPSRANVLMSMINAFSDPSPHNPDDPTARGREEGFECLKKVLKAKYDAKKIDETLLTYDGVIIFFILSLDLLDLYKKINKKKNFFFNA